MIILGCINCPGGFGFYCFWTFHQFNIYWLTLSVPRCSFRQDQCLIQAKCILSVYSEPFRCHLHTYCSSVFPQRKVLMLFSCCVKGKIIFYIVACIPMMCSSLYKLFIGPSLPPHTHTRTTHLLYRNYQLIVILTNSWPSSPKWQNVTFWRNWPISSGIVTVDSKFMVTKSFKRKLKGHGLVEGGGELGVWWQWRWGWVGRHTAHGCQTLGALPVHRLIIGHPSTLLWSPV